MLRRWAVLVAAGLVPGCGLIVGLKDRELFDGGVVLDGALPDAPNIQPDGAASCDAGDMSDPHNCGRCGHDCVGGTCTGGVCNPIMVCSATTTDVTALAVTATDLYFGGSTKTGALVESCPLDGGSPNLAATSSQPITALAVFDGLVFFVESGVGLYTQALDGGPPADFDSTPNITQVLAEPTLNTVYWTDDSTEGQVEQCAPPHCAVATNTTAQLTYGASAIAIAPPSTLYWAEAAHTDLYVCTLNGNCTSTAGGDTLSPGAHKIDSLAGNTSGVYFADTMNGAIFYCPSTGCVAGGQTVAMMESSPASLAIDANNLYWITATGVRYAPLPVVTAQTLVPTITVTVMAEDDVAIYYNDALDLWKIAKP